MLVRNTVIVNLSGLCSNPGAKIAITKGMNISSISINITNDIVSIAKMLLANNKALSFPSDDNFPLNSGTKAALNAPSANIFLKKLGSLKAIFSASAKTPVPKKEAINRSLINPKILEMKVNMENITLDFKNNFHLL